MRFIMIILLLVMFVIPVWADDPTTPASIPTPQPRTYSQAEIDALWEQIETTYGITYAVEAEWNATNANEVIWYTDDLHTILEALQVASFYMWRFADAPEDVTPAEFFRQIFDRAGLQIDRVLGIEGGFVGNTLPVYENSEVDFYVIQLAPGAMSNYFVFVHELGHVIDGLLADTPQLAFIEALGGEWATDFWIPGEGYMGNEAMFPRAVAGPNEDFADTFANFLLGRLESVPVRDHFMRQNFPLWMEAILAQDETPQEVE